MPRLYLVRHAHAATDASLDPALDDIGRTQAEAMARHLTPLGPLRLVTSPMARARGTAAPLAETWGLAPMLEPRVQELPSAHVDREARERWLQALLGQRWTHWPPSLLAWRDTLMTALYEQAVDTVIVTHRVAISLAVATATGNPSVDSYRPGYCSVTVLDQTQGQLVLVSRGAETDTRML